mmetsp:Transcript_20893/g.35925  ORF Transcript_20893/g.35925 Transcript_20893/m.35925 type:complete len:82 (+) Transcript_20893:1296-1541(+)
MREEARCNRDSVGWRLEFEGAQEGRVSRGGGARGMRTELMKDAMIFDPMRREGEEGLACRALALTLMIAIGDGGWRQCYCQ